MVKVTNSAGDNYKGKIGNQFYQGLYGFSVRKAQYKQTIPPSEKQLANQQRFIDAVNWVKTLDSEFKEAFKFIYNQVYSQYNPGDPANWFNFCKVLYMSQPKVTFSYPDDDLVFVEHPGILSIIQHDQFGAVVSSVTGISDVLEHTLVSAYAAPLSNACRTLIVTTVTGLTYEYVALVDHTVYINFPCPG